MPPEKVKQLDFQTHQNDESDEGQSNRVHLGVGVVTGARREPGSHCADQPPIPFSLYRRSRKARKIFSDDGGNAVCRIRQRQ